MLRSRTWLVGMDWLGGAPPPTLVLGSSSPGEQMGWQDGAARPASRINKRDKFVWLTNWIWHLSGDRARAVQLKWSACGKNKCRRTVFFFWSNKRLLFLLNFIGGQNCKMETDAMPPREVATKMGTCVERKTQNFWHATNRSWLLYRITGAGNSLGGLKGT